MSEWGKTMRDICHALYSILGIQGNSDWISTHRELIVRGQAAIIIGTACGIHCQRLPHGHRVAGKAAQCLHFGPLRLQHATLATLTQNMKKIFLLLCFKICSLALVFDQSNKPQNVPFFFSSLLSFCHVARRIWFWQGSNPAPPTVWIEVSHQTAMETPKPLKIGFTWTIKSSG